MSSAVQNAVHLEHTTENYFAKPAHYNASYQTAIIDAAAAIEEPFLVQQGYETIAGVALVSQSSGPPKVKYKQTLFTIANTYINPGPNYLDGDPAGIYAGMAQSPKVSQCRLRNGFQYIQWFN